MKTVRLNKYIADCTGISRRKADELIAKGEVRVNRKPATVGQVITPEKDEVFFQGKQLLPQRKLYVAFYKPKGYLTTRSDPEERKTIYDLLPEKYHHLDPAGRLDKDSTGILILSNDGDFIQRITHPSFEHPKIYRVKVAKQLTPETLRKLEAGVTLQPEDKLAQCQVQEIRDTKTVVLVLKTGLNRQIRRTFEALGNEVVDLKRITFAGITLKDLASGQTRELKPSEVRQLLPQTKPPKQRQKQTPHKNGKRKDNPPNKRQR